MMFRAGLMKTQFVDNMNPLSDILKNIQLIPDAIKQQVSSNSTPATVPAMWSEDLNDGTILLANKIASR